MVNVNVDWHLSDETKECYMKISGSYLCVCLWERMCEPMQVAWSKVLWWQLLCLSYSVSHFFYWRSDDFPAYHSTLPSSPQMSSTPSEDSRKCLNHPDNFCYICGKFTLSDQRRLLTSPVCEAYFQYFDWRVGEQEQYWAPHVCCHTCLADLLKWQDGKLKKMPFGAPMKCREPTYHNSDCYFCLTKISACTKKN